MGNPGTAEAELRYDPARSDAIIAAAARCTPQHVGRVRRRLAASGGIEAIPPADRLARPRTWPARPPRQAIEAGATTPQQVMQAAHVSYGTAWRALSRAQSKPQSAAVAAATDALSVRKSQPANVTNATIKRQPKIVLPQRPPDGFYSPADEIELACPACIQEWSAGGWQHERSCIARAR
jgi:hypothetical protein